METAIIIAGFGGQGVLFAGQLLAHAAMNSGRQVTWIPSYGPEMRGGTAHCVVILSDDPIGAPIVVEPEIAIVLNQPSFDRYETLVKPGGLLVVNSSIVDSQSRRPEIETVYIAANAIAGEFGSVKMLNMAALGAMLAYRPVLPLTAVAEALTGYLATGSKSHLVEANQRVLQRAFEVAASGISQPLSMTCANSRRMVMNVKNHPR